MTEPQHFIVDSGLNRIYIGPGLSLRGNTLVDTDDVEIIVGPTGPQGDRGIDGINGIDGESIIGPQGPAGEIPQEDIEVIKSDLDNIQTMLSEIKQSEITVIQKEYIEVVKEKIVVQKETREIRTTKYVYLDKNSKDNTKPKPDRVDVITTYGPTDEVDKKRRYIEKLLAPKVPVNDPSREIKVAKKDKYRYDERWGGCSKR